MATLCDLRIEIPILLIFFCFMLSDYVTTNFILYRTCYVTLGYNISDCALLGTNSTNEKIKDLESKVQPTASIILMVHTILDNIVPVLWSLIVGPWSNKHGRKPIFISSLIGYLIAYMAVITVSCIPWASPWWWMVSSLPSSLGGGICSMLTVTFCYIVDISSEENRGMRMGILEACFGVGALLGTVSSSYIFNVVGYTGIYIICASITFISILYSYFLLPESLNVVEQENKLKDLTDMSAIVKSVKATVKPRQNMDRSILCLLMTSLIIYIFVIFSDSSVFFLFVREKFNWSLQKYTMYSTVNSIIEIFGTFFILTVLHKYLKISDMAIILVGFAALSSSSFVFGFASKEWMIYLGSGIKRMSCTTSALARSAISKLLPPEDLGHVFALTTSLETITQLVSTPIYTLLYNKTLLILPSAFNFLSASMYAINVIIIGTVILIKRLHPNPDLRVMESG